MDEQTASGILPKRSRGRQSPRQEAEYAQQRAGFCALILQIQSTMDFKVGSRGWCYILEQHGLTKGEFDAGEALITDCRKTGDLPLGICAEDESRATIGLQQIDSPDVELTAQGWIEYVRKHAADSYTPFGFWDDLDVYVEMAVEKLDLRNLFEVVCREFYVPIANFKGWADLNSRAAMMQRFEEHESAGRQCVLLLCGDHDPGGLAITETMRKNLEDLHSVEWSPDNLIISRFGLNAEFIDAAGLTWIDNLETSSGGRLDDPRHKDHHKAYVQNYIRRFGVRKCEANALVVAPQIGRELCRQAILQYVPADAPARYRRQLEPEQRALTLAIQQLMRG